MWLKLLLVKFLNDNYNNRKNSTYDKFYLLNIFLFNFNIKSIYTANLNFFYSKFNQKNNNFL